MPRRLLAWALWWAASWWLWMLFVGDWNRIEWIGGACAATIVAVLAELARALGGVELRLPWRLLRHTPTAFAMIFVDFGILVAALVRRREGRFVVRDGAPAGDDEVAWVSYLATISPNGYVVDVDRERDIVLLHDLVEVRSSESPAG